ncbi:metal-independent alpha-mannosidase [Granulicella sp. 5B5]|nr:metal-independent alpha-mannosidase [Granulicella sp. 5B5]
MQWSRRGVLKVMGAASAGMLVGGRADAQTIAEPVGQALSQATTIAAVPWGERRPKVGDRKFRSAAVEAQIARVSAKTGDKEMARLFANCYPNTLDTTVEPGTWEGKPDTAVVTGDIAAMWLRDSSAQVWPYLPLLKEDDALRGLVEGVIRRQTRCLLIDTYANAFMADLNAKPLPWSVDDKTEMKQGVGERKYELDSLCYPIRLAHGYWKQSGDVKPFDAAWQKAMTLVVQTMRVQQRKDGVGPYHFQRTSPIATETLPGNGYGNPVRPVGLIASGFRPSDDACVFPFLVPSNLFAVTSLRQLAVMAHAVLKDAELAREAESLAGEVEGALKQYAVVKVEQGTGVETIWAYEVDGFGSQLLMDDANVPSLLGLPYLESSLDAALYARTRAFVWSARNPWFFKGTAGEGVGGPHEGKDMIWPMSQMVYALTSQSSAEIGHALAMLKASSAGTGFMHESYDRNDVKKFTRPWFAWANTLFGELIVKTVATRPELLAKVGA